MLIPGPIEGELAPLYADALEKALAFKAERENQQQQGLADGIESPAARWRKRYEAIHGTAIDAFIQPVEINVDEFWFLRLFSLQDLDEIGAIIARSGYTLFTIEDAEWQKTVTVAMLFVGVANPDVVNGRHFADIEEARAFYSTPGPAMQIARALRNVLFDINSFPELKKAMGGTLQGL